MLAPLDVKTHYSLLRSFNKPDKLLEKCAEYGYQACSLTDINTLAGAVEFSKSAKDNNIKPLLGLGLYNGPILLAKNFQGWHSLLYIVYHLSKPSNVEYDKKTDRPYPINQYETICKYASNIICLDGGFQSSIWQNYQEYDPRGLFQVFEDDYYILLPTDNRRGEIKKKFNHYKLAPAGSTYFTKKGDLEDFRLILACGLKSDIEDLRDRANKSSEPGIQDLANHNELYLKKPEELTIAVEQFEINNLKEIVNKCENYSILSNPKLPKFDCPNGLSSNEYMKELCRQGFRTKLLNTGKVNRENKDDYIDRVKQELEIFEEAGLADYFLVVQDFVNWAKKRMLLGSSRGSCGGCLIAYLMNITSIDPLDYGLLSSRFYNPGRNTEDNIHLPDIDVDVPKYKRQQIIDYLIDKYGDSSVGHISTFGKLKGKGALKEVMRINNVAPFSEINRITKRLPEEHKITDKLEKTGEDSSLLYTLKYEPNRVKNYCRYEDGKFIGDYAPAFEQAIRIEGVYRTQGVHAAGLVVGDRPLHQLVPMRYNHKDGNMVVGLDYEDAEEMGCTKLDLLSIDALDKLEKVNESLVNT